MSRSPRDLDAGNRRFTRRSLLMSGAMGAMMVGLGVRMHTLAVRQAGEFKLLAEENRVSTQLVPPARGLILDRSGEVLAGNEQNYRVVMTREGAGDTEMVLNRLSHLIPLTASDLERLRRDLKRNAPFLPITIADRLSWEDFSKIALNAPALPGVTPEVGLSRIYPRDLDFAHVLGYVGPVSERDLEGEEFPDPILRIPDFQIGKIGVERWKEDDLRGAAGTRRLEVNAVGRVMRELERIEGEPGTDLTTTLNAAVQNFIQARLGEESAACVVLDVENGDIIAAASSPSFDPNLFVRGISFGNYRVLTENERLPLANKVVQGAYPPGSTFKIVTALAALRDGQITPDHTTRCTGSIESNDRRFHCWKSGGHGRVDFRKSLAESCDIFYYEIAQAVGIEKISAMGRELGLGLRHELPMSAISAGMLPSKAWKLERYNQDWFVGDTINASIGQGFVLATPLQLAVMTARVASGRAVVPRLIRAAGGIPIEPPPAPPLDIDPDHLAAVREGLLAVVNDERGTALSSRVADPAMLMAGKTGTSQVRNISAAERADGVVANEDLPWSRRDHALFVGYAPADKPRYAVAVVVEHGGGGSVAAAPIARDAILSALAGGVPPLTAYPESQRGRMETLLNALPLREAGKVTSTGGRA
ncbi:MAG: penicillin-binding protein 2 [Paracoccaceae bacterium]